jgi:CHAT domain-containing protein
MTQLDSAQAALERALELGKRLSEVRVLARSYLGLGLVNIHREKSEDARESLIEAQVIVEQRGLDELAWRVDLALARAAELDGLEGEALEAAERAMAKVEAMRAAIAAEGLKSGFMEDKSQIYALAAALHLRRGNSSEALNVAERSRSRTFLDLLQSHRISRKAGLEAKIEAEEANLSRRISKLRIERDWLKAKGPQRTPEENLLLNQYIVELDSLETSYNHLLEEIESQHPGYRGLVAVDPEPPESIQARLRSGESLLEYYPISDGMVIFVVNSGKIKAKFVPISEDSLASLVFSLRNRLNNKLSIQEGAKTLYEWLIAPINGDLAGCYHLIIVPSGPLHYLPFALLQDESGNYLLDEFTLSFAPSASIFAFCRERSGQKPTIEKYPLLALGNPDTDLPQESLFFSEKEVTSIGFAFINAEMLLGNEAKESVLFEEAPNSSAVHLACHGIFDASNPMFSSLFLAPGGGEDGRLEMLEIFDLNLDHCSLVTLSACESGLGKVGGGEEIVGLTRSFIYAGSPRVISTLWKVDDLATAVLVKQFYRYLKSGMTPAGALRRAQQHVRRRIHSHPAYWAAFRLTGEPGGMLINAEVLN